MASFQGLGYLDNLNTPEVKVYWGIVQVPASGDTPIADQLALDILDRRRVQSFYADMKETS